MNPWIIVLLPLVVVFIVYTITRVVRASGISMVAADRSHEALKSLQKIFNDPRYAEPSWLYIDDMCIRTQGTFVIDIHELRKSQTVWRMGSYMGWNPTFSSRRVRR